MRLWGWATGLLVLLTACAAHDTQPPAPESTPDTGQQGEPTVACAARPDAILVVDCALTLAAPSTARLQVWRSDDPRTRTFVDDAVRARHVVGVWGLRADTRYDVRATDGDGALIGMSSFVTGAAPAEVPMQFTVTGATDQVEALLIAPRCLSGRHVMVDDEGALIGAWDVRQMVGAPPHVQILGGVVTPSGTALSVLGRHDVVEHDFTGSVRLHLQRGEHFDQPIHHQLARHGDQTLLLFAETVVEAEETYVMDGVYVFDGDRQVARWASAEHYTPTRSAIPIDSYWKGLYGEAHDFSHANSIAVDDAGDWVISFRHMNAIAKVSGMLDASDFGTVRWTLAPSEAASVVSDFTPSWTHGDPAFLGQHDASWTPEGTLLLLDNGPAWGSSRGLELTLDEVRGAVSVVVAYTMALPCPIQGGAVWLEGGHRLFTCAPAGRVLEFSPDAPEVPTWTLEASCHDGLPTTFPRAAPVRLYDGTVP